MDTRWPRRGPVRGISPGRGRVKGISRGAGRKVATSATSATTGSIQEDAGNPADPKQGETAAHKRLAPAPAARTGWLEGPRRRVGPAPQDAGRGAAIEVPKLADRPSSVPSRPRRLGSCAPDACGRTSSSRPSTGGASASRSSGPGGPYFAPVRTQLASPRIRFPGSGSLLDDDPSFYGFRDLGGGRARKPQRDVGGDESRATREVRERNEKDGIPGGSPEFLGERHFMDGSISAPTIAPRKGTCLYTLTPRNRDFVVRSACRMSRAGWSSLLGRAHAFKFARSSA